MTDPSPASDDRAFAALTTKISRDRGFGCASYKEKCLRRRIAVRMRARGVHTFEDYARLLDTDPAEYDRLIDALTINVTKLFRNWDTYAAIERTVIPELWRKPGEIRVWSAGSASGEEPYSLAILFLRHAQYRGEDAGRRVRIIGTDIDLASLEAARRAEYAETAFADTPPSVRQGYFTDEPPFRVVPVVRRLVTFEKRDLLHDAPPLPALDLIVCRNVLIYFDRATQERLFGKFHAALAPGGYLVLGKVETILGETRPRFQPVEPRERIFRKL